MRNRFFIGYFLFVLSTFLSCKKDKLANSTLVLQGKWKWINTYNLDVSYPINNSFNQNPSSENVNYSIEFTKTGYIYIYINEKKNKCYRLVFSDIHPEFQNPSFGISPDNKKKNNFYCVFYQNNQFDSLGIRGFFPFQENDPDNYHVLNYFIREN